MRTLLLFVLGSTVTLSTIAQCGSTWQVASDWRCGTPGATVVHRLAGGSPPFQITLYEGSTPTLLASGSGITTDFNPGMTITVPFRAVIVDASNCVQTVNCVAYTAAPQVNPPVSTVLAVDPETGLGGFSLTQLPVPFGNCLSYRVRQSSITTRTGMVANDWSSNAFRGLLPGTYAVEYNNTGCSNATLSNWASYDYLWPGTQPWGLYQRIAYCNAGHAVTIAVPASDPDPVRLPIKLFLEGPYDAGLQMMNDALRSNDKLPWRFPYTSLGYTLTNVNTTENMDPASRAVGGSNAYVDWVVVELRDASNPASIVYSRAALVQRDGDVVMQNGSGPLSCNIASGDYYVAVKHRNHLGLMTAAPVSLGLATSMVDFTDPATTTYGTAARKQVGNRMVLWTGDASANGILGYTGIGNDRDPILTAVGSTTPNNTVSNVYDRRDTNLDGVIKYTGTANDRDIILTNVGSTTPNNTRTQQLP